MASTRELEDFLREVSHRAYRQAFFAVKNEESAMDLVQESMMKLSDKYGDKPKEELPMLFTRILQNTILDYHRRQKVRNTWTTLFSSFQKKDEEDYDVLENLLAQDESQNASAQDEIEQSQNMAAIEEAIAIYMVAAYVFVLFKLYVVVLVLTSAAHRHVKGRVRA